TINLENYLTIIKPRYGGQITTDLFVEPETMDFEIPNLLLQPLVENAFFHAFQIQKQGTIRIFISLIKNRIHCSVIDNGDGMSDAKIKKVLSNSSNHISVTNIGLINIKERLELIYQDQCEFSIMSEPGLGTNISLSFPAIKPSQ
ncbi:MAG TPA: sensor histidine kinase, partial [Candidatus Dorea intestinavium]|nr:sensor histidine kinase [Candidatus Dorea intestinavium]